MSVSAMALTVAMVTVGAPSGGGPVVVVERASAPGGGAVAAAKAQYATCAEAAEPERYFRQADCVALAFGTPEACRAGDEGCVAAAAAAAYGMGAGDACDRRGSEAVRAWCRVWTGQAAPSDLPDAADRARAEKLRAKVAGGLCAGVSWKPGVPDGGVCQHLLGERPRLCAPFLGVGERPRPFSAQPCPYDAVVGGTVGKRLVYNPTAGPLSCWVVTRAAPLTPTPVEIGPGAWRVSLPDGGAIDRVSCMPPGPPTD